MLCCSVVWCICLAVNDLEDVAYDNQRILYVLLISFNNVLGLFFIMVEINLENLIDIKY